MPALPTDISSIITIQLELCQLFKCHEILFNIVTPINFSQWKNKLKNFGNVWYWEHNTVWIPMMWESVCWNFYRDIIK